MERTNNQQNIFLFVVDLIFVGVSLYISMVLRVNLPSFGGPMTPELVVLPWFVILMSLSAWSVSLILMETYHQDQILRAVDEVWRVVAGSLLAFLIMAGGLYFTYRDVSRFQVIYFYLISTFSILGYRGLLRIIYRLFKVTPPTREKRVLVLGAGVLGLQVAREVLNHSRWGYDLLGFLDDDPEKQGWAPEGFEGKKVLGKVGQVQEWVRRKQINKVILALPLRAHKELAYIVAKLQKEAVNITVVPDYFSQALVHAKSGRLGDIHLIHLRAPVIEGSQRLFKRMFDLVITVTILIFIWPLLVIIALLIRLDSPGPVLFNQLRVGENGHLFRMHKFRSMMVDAESHQEEINTYDEEGNVIHKHEDDPRVTRLGRFLRRTSLDELPQLFNVLKGEMSLVGPRPELPWLVEKYEPWQRKRFAVPQGITGWWQVNKRADSVMHLSTKDDLYYVYNYSLWLDIKILFMTIGALFRGY